MRLWSGHSDYERFWLESHWHPWFAWYPVRAREGVWVWLEWVSRKASPTCPQWTVRTDWKEMNEADSTQMVRYALDLD